MIHSRPAALAMLVACALALAACNRQSAAPAAPSPSLADIRSPEGQKQVQETVRQAALPAADPSVPAARYQKLDSGNQLMYMFYAVSGLPPDMERIANAVSQDYRGTTDGFRKQDIARTLQPRVAAEIERAKSARYVIWETSDVPIERYDFARKLFAVRPLYWDSGNSFYFNDNSGYHLSFSGGDAVRAFKVDDEGVARRIEASLSKFERLQMRLYVFARDADMNNNTVKAQVVRIELLDATGAVLAQAGP